MMRTSEPLPPTTLSPPGPNNVNGLRQPRAARKANRSADCHPIAVRVGEISIITRAAPTRPIGVPIF